MRKFQIYLYVLFFIIINACAPFIIKDTKPAFRDLEKKQYYLKKNIKIGEHNLKKGEKILIRIKDGKDTIKVYAFPTKEDPLKTKLVLILYMFDDDFKKKKFDLDLFKKKLFEIIR